MGYNPETRIIVAGSGGQGILFLGKFLARAGMLDGRNVTWFPSYGAEMRGCTANCTLILSDNMIGSPVILNPDILIAMNSASIERFQTQLKKKGLLLFDSSLMNGVALRDNIMPVGIPAAKIADFAGDVKAANMVMLGALIAATDILKKSSFDRLFSFSLAPAINKAAEINKNAITKGIKYLENKKSSNF
jgi:2-oxoglutarate ferredoxin oxidoreductase subunit gamma